MVRVNGFQGPYDPLQITGWSFIIFFLVTYFSVLAPILPSPGNIVCLVIGGIGALTVIISMLVGSFVNPADENVDCRRSEDSARDMSTRGKSPFDNSTYCYLCKVYVDKSAKHCRVCDKCVVKFDHHCKWLNNCVGSKNYKIFATVVISALCTAVFILGVTAYLLAMVASDDPAVLSSLNRMYPKFTKGGYIALLVIEILLLILTCVMLSQLLGLHIYLAYHKMSTYDHIIKKRKAKKAQELAMKGKGKGKGIKKGKVYITPGGAQRGPGTFATESRGTGGNAGKKGPWWKCGKTATASKYQTSQDSAAQPLTPSRRGDDKETGKGSSPTTAGKPPRPPRARPPPVNTNTTTTTTTTIQAGLPETPTWRTPKPKAAVTFDGSARASDAPVGLAYPVKKIDFAAGKINAGGTREGGSSGSGDTPTGSALPTPGSDTTTGGRHAVPLRTAHSASSVRLSQRSSTGTVRSTTSSRILTGRDWAEAGVIDPHIVNAPVGPGRVPLSQAELRRLASTSSSLPAMSPASHPSGRRHHHAGPGGSDPLPDLRSTPPPSPSLHFPTPEFVSQSAVGVPAEDAAPF